MTYKEYYLTLKSPEEIMKAANADIALVCVINPERMAIIKQHAEEAINEKFWDKCNAECLTIDDKIEYWHTHETGNSLREFLGMTEQEYLDFLLGKNTGEKGGAK